MDLLTHLRAWTVIELAGCDLLTISPKLLEELSAQEGVLTRKLDPDRAQSNPLERLCPNEETFRWLLNEDPMATEKLAEGIRRFNADLVTLAAYMQEHRCDR